MKIKYIVVLIVSLSLIGLSSFKNEENSVEFKLIEIPSPSLADAIISPNETYKIGVNLPPSYYNSNERYPVVYHLSGFTVYPGQYPSTYSINQALKTHAIKEMIMIDISGYNIFKGTMYTNSSVTGNWEDFITKDVINYVDKNYRTIPKREARGISGHSMGGAGCTNISFKHADKFAVAYPMSPGISKSADAMVQLMFPNDSTMMYLENLASKIGNVSDDKFQNALLKELDNVNSGNIFWLLGYGMAFAPDPTQPLKMNLPYDKQEDGSYVINKTNYQKWGNGFGGLNQKVTKYKENLLKYEYYALDCGYNDEIQFIIDGTERYIELLSKNNIPHSMNWYDGDHSSKVGDQLTNRVLPIMSVYLKGK